jgi:hypothetical protein
MDIAKDFANVTGSYTVTKQVSVGRRKCSYCDMVTPMPGQVTVDRAVKQGKNFIWPFDDWFPYGWGRMYTYTLASITSYLCPKCMDKRLKADG